MKKEIIARFLYCAKRAIFIAFLLVTFIASSFLIPDINQIYADDNSGITICIDPGHGGRDVGAIGPSGLLEKHVNFDIATRLRDKLAGSGFRVVMTREDDTKKTLEEIANFANSSNADLFISIHNNSHSAREKCGTETFYNAGSPGGAQFAGCINAKTIEQIGTLNRGVKSANYKQLINTKMTSALIEGAFISNPEEEAKLNDAGFRDKIATGIYNGIVDYLNRYRQDLMESRRVASAQSFVRQVYIRSLNIDPDQPTVDGWASKLAQRKTSHADFIKAVITSQQFAGRNLNDSQYLNTLYSVVLDRSPDEKGASVWLSQLKSISRAAVLNAFLASDEFKALLNQYSLYGYRNKVSVAAGSSNTASSQPAIDMSGNGPILSFLNGVGIRGIAYQASLLFNGLKDNEGNKKYRIYKIIDADSYNYKNTLIICKSQKQEILDAAQEVKNILKVGVIKTQDGNAQVSDVVVIIGKDFSPGAASSGSTDSSSQEQDLIKVNILNGRGTQGIAASAKLKVESSLNKDKKVIKVTETKNADSFGYKNTKIIIFTSKAGVEDTANNLKKLLGKGEIVKSSNNVDNVDITIIIGADY